MFSRAYKRYALATMTLVVALNFFDRGLMGLLLQPIKVDLGLTDTQLGFVTGIAFALFYSVLGVPIARWADRGDRVTITSLAIGFWGLTMMACLFVTSFVHLIIVRVAAAVGEAGGQPPTYSLLGDYFTDAAGRTRAMYVYQSAGPLSGLASFMLAGWLNEWVGWRMTFFLVGIPGLLLAVLVRRTLVEPRVGNTSTQARRDPPSTQGVVALLWRRQSCRHLSFSMILILLATAGVGPWYAAFMMRSHGMGTAELGVWLGLVAGLSGLAGIVLGSFVIGRWFANDGRAQLRLAAIGVAAAAPLLVAFLTVSDKHLALAALIPEAILIMAFLPAPFALLQRLVPEAMRASAYMVILLLANLAGMGMGPLLVGALSDALTPRFGADGLRYAMSAVSLLVVWAAWHLWRAGRTVTAELAEADTGDRFAVGQGNLALSPSK
jgi:MFS family permease